MQRLLEPALATAQYWNTVIINAMSTDPYIDRLNFSPFRKQVPMSSQRQAMELSMTSTETSVTAFFLHLPSALLFVVSA